MHWWRGSRDTPPSRPVIYKIILKIPGERSLRLRRDALLKFTSFLVDKAEQNVIAAHTLAHMANARMLFLHPGVNKLLKRVHAVSTEGAVKAFKPVHILILSGKSTGTMFAHSDR
jgi:hypothetical protein